MSLVQALRVTCVQEVNPIFWILQIFLCCDLIKIYRFHRSNGLHTSCCLDDCFMPAVLLTGINIASLTTECGITSSCGICMWDEAFAGFAVYNKVTLIWWIGELVTWRNFCVSSFGVNQTPRVFTISCIVRSFKLWRSTQPHPTQIAAVLSIRQVSYWIWLCSFEDGISWKTLWENTPFLDI